MIIDEKRDVDRSGNRQVKGASLLWRFRESCFRDLSPFVDFCQKESPRTRGHLRVRMASKKEASPDYPESKRCTNSPKMTSDR